MEGSNPDLALVLNPANADARVNAVLALLNEEPDADISRATAQSQVLLALSPADARGYSLLGTIYERGGRSDDAILLYQTALAHSKTEIHALMSMAELRLRENDLEDAFGFLDLILKRWPEYWPTVAPIFERAVKSENGRRALLGQLKLLPPWRAGVIAQLIKSPAGLVFSRDLILASNGAARAAPGWRDEVNVVIAALAAAGSFGEARRVFLGTLDKSRLRLAGLVFDSTFTQPPNQAYYGWRVAKEGSLEVLFPAATSQAQAGLLIRFFDTPATSGAVTQRLVLPAGKYELRVTADADGLDVPKRLYWRLTCDATRRPMADVAMDGGTYRDHEFSVEFEVPTEACPSQSLSLNTDVTTGSWRDRYKGDIQFSALQILPV